MTKEAQLERLSKLDELLENVEFFGWIDHDPDGPSGSQDSEAPKEARKLVSELIAGCRE